MEAVISRMKTIRASDMRSTSSNSLPVLRFVAVSATIPNIDDVSTCIAKQDIICPTLIALYMYFAHMFHGNILFADKIYWHADM